MPEEKRKEKQIFASKVAYLAEDTIESGALKEHEVMFILREVAKLWTDTEPIVILTRESIE